MLGRERYVSLSLICDENISCHGEIFGINVVQAVYFNKD